MIISRLAANATFSKDAIFVDVGDRNSLKDIAITYEQELADWAKLFGKTWTILRCTGNQLGISADLSDIEANKMVSTSETIQIANMLWFGNVPVTPELFRLAADLIENPRRAGITRLPDERQIILTNESGFSLKNSSLEEAVTWKRTDYWHPADLEEFRHRCQQELSVGGESYIEHSYRTFEPTLGPNDPTVGNWARMTQRYRLFDGNDGNFYQLCEALDIEELELQTI